MWCYIPGWLADDAENTWELWRLYWSGERLCRRYGEPGLLTACTLINDANEGETLLARGAKGLELHLEEDGEQRGIAGYALVSSRLVRVFFILLTALLWLRPLTDPPEPSVPMPPLAVAVVEIVILVFFLWELRIIYVVQGRRVFLRDPRCLLELAAIVLAVAAIRPVPKQDDAPAPRVAPLMASASQCSFVLFRFCHLRRAAWDLGAVVIAALPTLALVFLVVLTFATFIFATVGSSDVRGYHDLYESFLSALVLVTAANFPDTMLEVKKTAGSSIEPLFVVYLVLVLYFLMNLVLAVVYTRYRRRAGSSVVDRLELQRFLLSAAFRILSEKGGPPRTAATLRGIDRTDEGLFRCVVARGEDSEGQIWIDEFHPAPPKLVEMSAGLPRRLRAFLWHHIEDMRQPPGVLSGTWEELDCATADTFGFEPGAAFDASLFGSGEALQVLLRGLIDQGFVCSVRTDAKSYTVELEEEAHILPCGFACMMEALQPRSVDQRADLMFKTLQITPGQWRQRAPGLSLEDFLNLTELLGVSIWWKLHSSGTRGTIHPLRARVRSFLTEGRSARVWRWVMNTLLTVNIVLNYLLLSLDYRSAPVDFAFAGLYICDAWFHLFGIGFAYLRKPWDALDVAVVHGNLLITLLAEAGKVRGAVAVFPVLLRLPRLVFRLPLFRSIFSTFLILLPRSGRLAVLLAMVLHMFACLGEALFAGVTDPPNTQGLDGWNETEYVRAGYESLNFDNLWRAYLTLFHLLVVNNWQVTMYAFMKASGTRAASLFFCVFHFLVVVIVLNVLVAFVIEAFDLASARDVLEEAPSMWEQRMLALGVSKHIEDGGAAERMLVVRRPQRTWDFTRAMFYDIVADFARRYRIPLPRAEFHLLFSEEEEEVDERPVIAVSRDTKDPNSSFDNLGAPMISGAKWDQMGPSGTMAMTSGAMAMSAPVINAPSFAMAPRQVTRRLGVLPLLASPEGRPRGAGSAVSGVSGGY
eukprot:Hpha_TRINITY_DN18980_c0_g1::TRINITY_DN18980_c0_g1_i1::g.17596::m.17596/K16896/TPCN1; two pore calcium channel protein 1